MKLPTWIKWKLWNHENYVSESSGKLWIKWKTISTAVRMFPPRWKCLHRGGNDFHRGDHYFHRGGNVSTAVEMFPPRAVIIIYTLASPSLSRQDALTSWCRRRRPRCRCWYIMLFSTRRRPRRRRRRAYGWVTFYEVITNILLLMIFLTRARASVPSAACRCLTVTDVFEHIPKSLPAQCLSQDLPFFQNRCYFFFKRSYLQNKGVILQCEKCAVMCSNFANDATFQAFTQHAWALFIHRTTE